MPSLQEKRLALLQDRYICNNQKKFLEEFAAAGGNIEIIEDKRLIWFLGELLGLLCPMEAEGQVKIRIGGEGDGGYVMLDPGQGGIAYSLGVSSNSPWDIEMAERGFTVYQYDGSINKEPDEHPNIFFHKYFVSGAPKEGPYKTVSRIIAENGHQEENDIILQMDIEGDEWEVLNSLTAEELRKFKQIVIEFHYLGFSPFKFSVLEKLRETHTPVHFHYNDNVTWVKYLPQLDFIYSDLLIEVTYARNDSFTFTNCEEYFPTTMDRPNVRRYSSDIPIGYFSRIMAKC